MANGDYNPHETSDSSALYHGLSGLGQAAMSYQQSRQANIQRDAEKAAAFQFAVQQGMVPGKTMDDYNQADWANRNQMGNVVAFMEQQKRFEEQQKMNNYQIAHGWAALNQQGTASGAHNALAWAQLEEQKRYHDMHTAAANKSANWTPSVVMLDNPNEPGGKFPMLMNSPHSATPFPAVKGGNANQPFGFDEITGYPYYIDQYGLRKPIVENPAYGMMRMPQPPGGASDAPANTPAPSAPIVQRATGDVVSVSSPADVARLPRGRRYLAPDGIIYIKN